MAQQRYRREQTSRSVEENEGQLEGRNALTEALRSGRTIDKVFIASGEIDRGLQRLAAQAKEAGGSLGPHSLCPQPFENSTGLHLKRMLKAMMSPSAMGDICVCFTLGFLLRFR